MKQIMKNKKKISIGSSSSKRMIKPSNYQIALRFSKVAARLSSSSSSSSSPHYTSTATATAATSSNISSSNHDEVQGSANSRLSSAAASSSSDSSSPPKEMAKRRCNRWMRFCFLFSVLQPILPSSMLASLHLLWKDMQACKITREEFIASFRHIAGDQILAESIKSLQTLQARDIENCNSS